MYHNLFIIIIIIKNREPVWEVRGLIGLFGEVRDFIAITECCEMPFGLCSVGSCCLKLILTAP